MKKKKIKSQQKIKITLIFCHIIQCPLNPLVFLAPPVLLSPSFHQIFPTLLLPMSILWKPSPRVVFSNLNNVLMFQQTIMLYNSHLWVIPASILNGYEEFNQCLVTSTDLDFRSNSSWEKCCGLKVGLQIEIETSQ